MKGKRRRGGDQEQYLYHAWSVLIAVHMYDLIRLKWVQCRTLVKISEFHRAQAGVDEDPVMWFSDWKKNW